MTAPSFDVAREFSYPGEGATEEGARLAEECSEVFVELAEFLATNLPGGRLKSLTMTTLQEAFNWATRSALLDTPSETED